MQPLVLLKNVSVKINQQSILDNISLAIQSHKMITILGPNGAGKSTLVKLVLGLIKPTKGTVEKRANLTIGYVPQSLKLDMTLPITVSRFIRLNDNIDHDEVLAILEQVKASKLINKSMHQLSGGEMQRVLLAQALIKKPQLLILDEPTQGVDINGQILLYDLIAKVKEVQKCGILMVSHDLHLVMAKTDEVICINQHVCCSGTPERVSNSPEFIKLFGTQAANQLAIYQHHHAKQYHGKICLPHFGVK